MDSRPTRIDVQLTVNGQLVANPNRYPLAELGVVVELEPIPKRVDNFDLLVIAGVGRWRNDGCDERLLCARATGRDIGVESIDIGPWWLGIEPHRGYDESGCDKYAGGY